MDVQNGKTEKPVKWRATQIQAICSQQKQETVFDSNAPDYIRSINHQWWFEPRFDKDVQICDDILTLESKQVTTVVKTDVIKVRVQPDEFTRTTPLPTTIYIEYGKIYTLNVEQVIASPPTCYTPDFKLS